jgi:hypothetical protein
MLTDSLLWARCLVCFQEYQKAEHEKAEHEKEKVSTTASCSKSRAIIALRDRSVMIAVMIAALYA